MDGTEITAALKFACEAATNQLRSSYSLMDRSDSNFPSCTHSSASSILRPRGIGILVSISMCNGIAHFVNGIAQYMANPTEGLTRKSARLLTAAVSPRPIKISLNISPEGSGADDLESVAASSKGLCVPFWVACAVLNFRSVSWHTLSRIPIASLANCRSQVGCIACAAAFWQIHLSRYSHC